MSIRPARRAPRPRMSSVQLVLSIALGLWLGALLIALTAWLAWRYGDAPLLFQATTGGPPAASAPAMAPRPAPPAPAPRPTPSTQAAPAQPGADAMFDQYQQNLHQQALRDIEAGARANPSNQNNAACQFWLQQAQTAPSEHSREQVAKLCQ